LCITILLTSVKWSKSAQINELAANLFRITQTDEKIIKDKIKGDDLASKTHFMVGGKVRQTIKDIGGTTPENLPPERHIKELKNVKRKVLKENKE
jgi:DNA-damage-inducible protein D